MEDLIKQTKALINKISDKLFMNLNDFELIEITEHTAEYKFCDEYIQIWISNGVNCCGWYESYKGVVLSKTELTQEQRQRLWDKVEADKTLKGETRGIKMTKMHNDLFFSFMGIYDEVRFTGYDDNDWWTKYCPKVQKENDDIIWKIDYDKMEAIYQIKDKKLINKYEFTKRRLYRKNERVKGQ